MYRYTDSGLVHQANIKIGAHICLLGWLIYIASLLVAGNGGSPALAYAANSPSPLDITQHPLPDAKSIVDAIFGDGTLWAAVPKKRRSYDNRWTRRWGEDKVRKFMTPRFNLVSCLHCGHWHERHTVCGKFFSVLLKASLL